MEVEKEQTCEPIKINVLLSEEIDLNDEIKMDDLNPNHLKENKDGENKKKQKEKLIDKVGMDDTISSEDKKVYEEEISKAKTPKSVYFYSYFVSLGGILLGYNSVNASGILNVLESLYHLNGFQVSFIISSFIFGAIFGALFAGILSEFIGLKKTIFIASIFFILSTALQTFANGYTLLIIGRILTGVGSGISSSSIPMYISEISTSEKRGQLTNSFVLFVTLSQFAAYVFTAVLINVPHQWRIIFGFSFIPSIILFVTCFFIPESARLLLRNKKSVAAFEELKKVRWSESIAQKEIYLIRQSLTGQKNSLSFRNLFCVSSHVRALIYSIFIISFSQLVGINAVMYFTPSILNSIGISKNYVSVLSLLPSGINFLMTIPSLILVDKFGRRKLLIFSSVGVLISLFILVMAFKFQINMLILFGLGFYIFNFAVGFGPLPGLISAELNSSSIANAISSTTGWISNFLVASCFLLLIHSIPIYAVFLIFFCNAFISLVFTYFYLPETRGKSKESIETMLEEKRIE